MEWNLLFTFFALPCIVLGTSESAKFITYKNDILSPLTEGKCKMGNEKMIEQGDTWYRDDYCEKVYCLRSGNLGHVEVRGCTPIAPLSPNCTVVHNKGLYPDCCSGHIICEQQPEPKSDVEMAEMIRALLQNRRK
uniref:Venom protein n=1 Tax=Hadrurus spadix TaxID=141984 RepID=A0A1W7R953_9SCOR